MTTPAKRRKRFIDLILACTNSVGELLMIYLGMVLVGAVGFSYFEQKPFSDGLWWAVVTSTTTGYGDLSPATWQGRVLGSALMLLSILIVLPLLIGYIASRMIEDHDAFTHHEQEEIKARLEAILQRLEQAENKAPD